MDIKLSWKNTAEYTQEKQKRLHVGSYSCMLTYVNDLFCYLFDYDDNPVCDKMM